MLKIFNGLLNVLKMIMLLICFVLTFYIIIRMYQRLDKPFIGSISNFIPFIVLFILFCVNFIFIKKQVNQNVFYNVTCVLVFSMLGFCIYRTFFDKNMIVLTRLGYDINFNYFADVIAPMKVLLYTLSVTNVLLIISGMNFSKKTKVVTKKQNVENL